MNVIQIRQVGSENEVKVVVSLAGKIWTEHYMPIIGAGQIEYMLDKYQSFEAISDALGDGYIYYIAYHNDSPCGYCSIKEDNGIFLSKFYVEKDSRGKGVGKAMMEKITKRAWQYGAERIWLTCNKHNEKTLEIYSKLGFNIIDSIVTDIGNSFVMDDYVLELFI